MAYMPKCWAKKDDCFAITPNNTCTCLKNTKFSNGCPFYKSYKDVDTNEIEKSVKKYEDMKGAVSDDTAR